VARPLVRIVMNRVLASCSVGDGGCAVSVTRRLGWAWVVDKGGWYRSPIPTAGTNGSDRLSLLVRQRKARTPARHMAGQPLSVPFLGVAGLSISMVNQPTVLIGWAAVRADGLFWRWQPCRSHSTVPRRRRSCCLVSEEMTSDSFIHSSARSCRIHCGDPADRQRCAAAIAARWSAGWPGQSVLPSQSSSSAKTTSIDSISLLLFPHHSRQGSSCKGAAGRARAAADLQASNKEWRRPG